MKTDGPAPRKPTMFPILLAAFIDMVGIGIVIPVVAPLIIKNETGIVPADWSVYSRDIVLGLLFTSYPLAQFFGAPVLGALSDRHGRKPVLSMALMGSMAGYVLFAVGIWQQALPLLFIGRTLDGFTGGNISIVYSSVADLSDPDSRARNFGLVGMMAGFGFVIGPALGGVLADPETVSWFNPAMPYWVSAGLCGLNAVLVMTIFRETLREKTGRRVNPFTGIRNIGLAFSLPRLKTLFSVVFLLTIGFAFFTTFFSVFMIKKFDYAEEDLGILFFWVGVWIAFTQGVVVRVVSRFFRPRQVLRFSIIALAIILPLQLLPDQAWMIFLLIPLVALAHGLGQPNMAALISAEAKASQQGIVLGINQSMASLGNAIPPLLAGFLSSLDVRLPTIAAAVFTLTGWFVFVIFFRKQRGSVVEQAQKPG